MCFKSHTALGEVGWTSWPCMHLRQFPNHDEDSSTLEHLCKICLGFSSTWRSYSQHEDLILLRYCDYVHTFAHTFSCLAVPEALKIRPLPEQVTPLHNKNLASIPFHTHQGCCSTSQLCLAIDLGERQLMNNE